MPAPPMLFHETGSIKDKITVENSLQIIGLFSEELHSNPDQAIERNSFPTPMLTLLEFTSCFQQTGLLPTRPLW